MKTIKTTLTSTGDWLRHHARVHTAVAVLVFAVGLAATIYYWYHLRQSVAADMNAAYTRQVRAIGISAGTKMQLYENFLRGGAGLYKIHDSLTQEEWAEFHEPYDITAKYPDIEGIGISRYLKKDELPAYLERRAALGDKNFQVFPDGDRDVYVPVTLNAAYTGNNGKSRGYDGYTHPIRRAAMDKALETGKPSMSGKIKLVSESRPDRASFILYLPIYKEGVPISTAVERREALLGFSYIAVDFQGLIESVLKADLGSDIALQMYDAEAKGEEGKVYQSQNFASIIKQQNAKIETNTFELYGHKWRVTIAASPTLLSERDRQLPDQALWRGVITCLFFAGLVWYLITDRERKYARQKQQEVQTAKDDLLSLASHQLRTPATVVKQYVGMLLQGYAGKLSQQQVGMLTNAYESNERQLEIINQLLYVARLDAGRITLRRKKLDITKLMQDVARDQSQAVAARNQQLSFKLPKRALWAELDPHYTRMVLENLLSNAVKYTPEGGSITLSLRRTPGHVYISVADTGVGIDPTVQPNIFEKFTRVENELSTDVNGSGVGLYLTQQIVELHGGTIEVRSTLNEGSIFIVRLPLKAPNV
ncbi:MAG TPA: CHASE domain-containing protein [Candidatus Saccharimonadales bacterium]|nr:CHASE domain-containing protein [Candidatus Saccharimonadales bacterium]